MPNTTRGFPYPPPTDHPPDVPADLQALAEAIDADLTRWLGSSRLKLLGTASDGAKWVVAFGDGNLTFYSDGASTRSLSGVADIILPDDGRTYRARAQVFGDGRYRTAGNSVYFGQGGVIDAFAAAAAVLRANCDPATDRLKDTSRPSWQIVLDGRSGQDRCVIQRAPATGGALAPVDVLSLAPDGEVTSGGKTVVRTASTPSSGQGLVWDGSGWVAADVVQTNDARLSDQRVPTDGSVTNAKVAAGAAIAESKLALASDGADNVATRRTLGTAAQQAAKGNHTHDDRYYTEGEADNRFLKVLGSPNWITNGGTATVVMNGSSRTNSITVAHGLPATIVSGLVVATPTAAGLAVAVTSVTTTQITLSATYLSDSSWPAASITVHWIAVAAA